MRTRRDRAHGRPTTSAEVWAFLDRQRTTVTNEVPPVRIEGDVATIRLYDAIDDWGEWWGMSAKEFAEVVDGLPSHIATIELLVNSPGGSVFDGVAIVNVMRGHPARTRAIVEGLAASAASFIAAAADETVMQPNSTMMIHNARGICIGEADDMLTMAGLLEKINGNIADIYAAKSGRAVDELLALMTAETWLSESEAVELGLADRVGTADDSATAAAAARASMPRPPVSANDVRRMEGMEPLPPAETTPRFLEIAANAHRRRR